MKFLAIFGLFMAKFIKNFGKQIQQHPHFFGIIAHNKKSPGLFSGLGTMLLIFIGLMFI